MVVHKRKKVFKYRGHTTHGWGSKKRHRGAGSRGGRGMAGTGKRAGQKRPSIMRFFGNEYFGKHGFKIPLDIKKNITCINIKDLPETQEVNLTAMGYQKLLSQGHPTLKYKIIVAHYSAKAKEKIEKAGGQISTK